MTGSTPAPDGLHDQNPDDDGTEHTSDAGLSMDDRLAGRSSPGGPTLPPLRVLPPGRRRLPGPVLGQLVAIEIAAYAVALAAGASGWVLALTSVLALLAAALLLGRWRGRWLYQHVLLYWRFRRRQRRQPVPVADTAPPPHPATSGPPADGLLGALRELVPGVDIVEVTDGRSTFGCGYDGVGWFAALAVDAPGTRLPLRRLAQLITEDGMTRLQVTSHDRPAPVAWLNTWAPAVVSYQEAAAKLAGHVPPAEHRTHLVVRLDVEDAPAAAAGTPADTAAVRRALRTCLGHLRRELAVLGLAHRVLGADGLTSALACELGLATSGPATSPPEEPRTEVRWDRVLADGFGQAAFQITRWPPEGERVLASLAVVPAAWTGYSLLLGRVVRGAEGDSVPVRAYLSLGAPADAFGRACAELAGAAELQGLTLRRLDGEQAAAALYTASTGGAPAVGWAGHSCPADRIDELAPTLRAGGVLLGRDPDRRPVLVPVFRDRPVRLVLVGALWPARLVLLRCLAVGARAVAGAGCQDWVSLGRWATGTDHGVLPPGAEVPRAHPATPVLLGADSLDLPAPAVAWQSVAAVCARPSPALLGDADLLITGRLLPGDMELVAERFGISGEPVRLLSRMYDDMIAVVEPGRVRFAWPTPSTAEREVLTPPQARPAVEPRHE